MRSRVFRILLLIASSSCLAQSSDPTPTLRTEVRLAHANAIVTDKRTHTPIENLEATDFHVYDNGVEQKLTHFGLVGKDDRPLALVILVDGWIFDSNLAEGLPEAVSRMAAKLRPDDRIALIGYGSLDENCRLRLSKDDIAPFTHDPAPVVTLLHRFADGYADVRARCHETRKPMKLEAKEHPEPRDEFRGTLPAARIATDLLASETDARPEIIAFTDDVDFFQKEKSDAVLDRLQATDVTVNVIETGLWIFKPFKLLFSISPHTIQGSPIDHFAKETGGLILSPQRNKLDDALEDLLLGIRAEYDLAWKVPASSTDHHTIRIELKNHKHATLHTRTGYSTTATLDPSVRLKPEINPDNHAPR